MLFKNLQCEVGNAWSSEDKDRIGSIGWYTTTVKLDLEVKGEIKRLEGVTP